MEHQNTLLYTDLLKNYKEANPTKFHTKVISDVSSIWKNLKKEKTFPTNVHAEILKWKQKKRELPGNLDKFMVPIPRPSIPDVEIVIAQKVSQPASEVAVSVIDADENLNVRDAKRVYDTPAEEKIKRDIIGLNQDIVHLITKRDSGLATAEQLLQLNEKRRQLRESDCALKKLLGSRERNRRKREREKIFYDNNPDVAAKLKKRDGIGRPRIETDQPGLLNAIIDIATHGAAADERRRSEALRSIKTLDELCSQLQTDGYQISRSATYLRLLPRRSNSIEGKRHVNTVPVKLKRAFNDLHKSHVDAKFCTASINYLEEAASILGKQVLFLSQDDKARVPIGITAANKQAPMLMHLDYRIKLPDHDWVVGDRHKLIPSVYGFMQVKENCMGDRRAVTYRGPTYIAIRSGKHCSSTASSHGQDFDSLIMDEDFLSETRLENGEVKPVIMMTVDGGPDENPRYEKVINEAICTFKKHDLDAIFIATNAPGRSAYNRVERRMAPLSRELCGVILQHDHYGTHLDDQGRTIDEELEVKNFKHAGETLATIWNSVVIDGCITKAIYITSCDSGRGVSESMSTEWKRAHVREGHYFLQIAKCDDLQCCSPRRSTYRNLLPRFIPAPLCLDQTTMTPSDNSDISNQFSSLLLRLRITESAFQNTSSKEVPFDLCCPSVKELIPSRTCQVCGLYFASVKSLKQHKRICRSAHSALNAVNATSFLAARINNRPVRIAAQRQRERMVIWSSRLNDNHVDWLDEDDLEGVQIQDHVEQNLQHSNIVSLAIHMNTPWENDV